MDRLATLVTPGAAPLAVADLRAWARLDDNGDDALLTTLLASACAWVEAQTNRALTTQTWRLALDAWPPMDIDGVRRVPLRPGPVASVTTITVDGTALAGSVWTLRGAVVIVDRNAAAPAGPMSAGILITYQAGGAANTIPRPLLDAILMIAAAAYADRETTSPPAAVWGLIAPYRDLGAVL